MKNIEKISVRDLQHKLSSYLEVAKIKPLLVTKHGKDEVVLVNPKQYKIVKTKTKKKTTKDIMASPFIGMYKNKREWKGKPSVEIAEELRKKVGYGK